MTADPGRAGRLLLVLGLLALLGLAFADFRAKQRTVIGPTTQLQADGPRATRPLAAESAADGLPDRLFRDDDAYYWISYARTSIEERRLRLRHSKIDNAPYGREIHWCSGPTWLLALLAGPVHLAGERSLDETLSLTALFLHPLLFTVLLAGSAALLARRIGPLATLGLCACFLLTPVLSRDMSYGTVDHHALLLLCSAGTLLCIQLGGAGYAAAGSGAALRSARRWTIASAICAGAGLWVQAIFQSLLLGSIALGALLGGALVARVRGEPSYADDAALPVPELWRTWGRVGAATSLIFYAVEYFPSNLGMRLEVNHPLYALALLAGGELTFRVLRWLGQPSRGRLVADLPLLTLCTVGILSPALAVWLGPSDWFWLRDPLLQRVHETVRGYQPAAVLIPRSGPTLRLLLGEFGALPLLGLCALWVLVRCRGEAARCARISVALVPALVALLLYIRFVRNGGLAVTALIALGFAVLIPAEASRNEGTLGRAVVASLASLLLLCGSYVWYEEWQSHQRYVGSGRFAPGWVRSMGYRDLARELRARVAEDERVTMTGSDLAPSLAYFGGFAVTSGLYWENREGLRATVDFFAAYDEREARAIVERRGIRYVIFWAGPPAPARWHRLRYGNTDPQGIRRSLGHRLADSQPPPSWLEEITAEFPRTAAPFGVKVYRVLARSPEPAS